MSQYTGTRHPTNAPSFRTVLTTIDLEKSDDQCQTYWDRLRTLNFKTAENWYTEQVYSEWRTCEEW